MKRKYEIEIESGISQGLSGVERAFDKVKNSLFSSRGTGDIANFKAAQKELEEVKPSASDNKQLPTLKEICDNGGVPVDSNYAGVANEILEFIRQQNHT
jgi:hypothetical protein